MEGKYGKKLQKQVVYQKQPAFAVITQHYRCHSFQYIFLSVVTC